MSKKSFLLSPIPSLRLDYIKIAIDYEMTLISGQIQLLRQSSNELRRIPFEERTQLQADTLKYNKTEIYALQSRRVGLKMLMPLFHQMTEMTEAYTISQVAELVAEKSYNEMMTELSDIY